MNNILDEMQLQRLYDCAISSKYGLADQGFPKTMQQLAAQGFVEKKHNGYIITNEGLLYIKVNKERLFGKSRRRKLKKYEDEDYSEE